MSCVFPKCHNDDILTWLTKPLCQKHWDFVCDHREEAEKKLNITVAGGVRQEGIAQHEDREVFKLMNQAAEPLNLDLPS
jgi:hypothetical protein